MIYAGIKDFMDKQRGYWRGEAGTVIVQIFNVLTLFSMKNNMKHK